MIILVCGGRKYNQRESVFTALDKLHKKHQITLLIHGDCKGADKLGETWAKTRGVHYAAVPALWDIYGPSAGSLRNQIMLLINPKIVVAFPGNNGTRHMTSVAESQGVKIWRPEDG